MTTPVKVLYVAGELTAGGYQRQLHLLISRLDRSAITPLLAVWRYEETQPMAAAFRKLDIEIFPVSRAGGRARRQWDLGWIVRQAQAQYVHSYCFYTNWPTWMAARTCGVAGVLGSFRNDYWHEVADVGLFGRLCARYPRLMICNSEAAAASIRAHGTAFRPRRLWVVPNAVDTEAFRPPNDLGVPSRAAGEVQLIGVGRLTAQKRWPWLLAVLKHLTVADRLARWHLTLCGEGEERTTIVHYIAELGLGDHVSVVGHQADIAGWLARSDMLLLSSAYEGTPNVVAEALSCGVPVLCTGVGDVRELVRDGIDGYVVGVDDAAAYAARLRELLLSPELRRRMGQSGRFAMVQSRSAETLVQNTLRVYREAGWHIP